LIMDSLRYFVGDCHVDGFRFDLASALAREFHEVDRLSAFFDIIHQDPVLSQVKLIAEPWDLGEGGYQVGNFPVLWTEWNGLYRDVMRDFWRGQARLGDFAFRFTRSADLYERDGRRPSASINFITAHDRFTLPDLDSYNQTLDERRSSLLEFTQRLIRLRQEHLVFRRSTFLEGVAETSGLPDVYWFRPDGRRMTRRDWDSGPPRLGVFLNGAELGTRTPRGEP